MINLTATSESSPQVLYTAKVNGGSGYWWAVRCVGWISQRANSLETDIKTKWQVGAYNYWPYWNDVHAYSVTINGTTRTDNFNLPQDKSNVYRDKSSAKTITVHHNSTTGAFSGTISISGYKCWEAFSFTDSISVPTLTVPEPSPEPSPTPEPDSKNNGVPIVNDTDPKYYILADGKVIYSMNDEDFYVSNPKLTLSLNQTDNLTFTLPPTNIMYDQIDKLSTTIEVRQGSEVLFRGRVLSEEMDFYNSKEVYCEGALSFLGDTIMAPYSAGTYTTAEALLEAALEQHAEQVPEDFPDRLIFLDRCTVSASLDSENLEYSYTSDVVRSLLDEIGGYLKLEYYDDGETGLSYLSSIDHETSQSVEFGQNLLDLTETIDAADIYTSVVCLGAADENTGVRLTTGSGSAMFVEDPEAIAVYGRIIRTFTYDDITDQSELRAVAQSLLEQGTQLAVTFSVKAVDMHLVLPTVEKIRVGDSVPIITRPHNIDSYIQCSEISIDMQNPDNTTYTFGATIKALTDTTSKQ